MHHSKIFFTGRKWYFQQKSHRRILLLLDQMQLINYHVFKKCLAYSASDQANNLSWLLFTFLFAHHAFSFRSLAIISFLKLTFRLFIVAVILKLGLFLVLRLIILTAWFAHLSFIQFLVTSIETQCLIHQFGFCFIFNW